MGHVTTPQGVLRKATRVLQRSGWCRNRFCDRPCDPFHSASSAVGAIWLALGVDPYYESVAETTTRHLGREAEALVARWLIERHVVQSEALHSVLSMNVIEYWNDHVVDDRDEVIAAFTEIAGNSETEEAHDG